MNNVNHPLTLHVKIPFSTLVKTSLISIQWIRVFIAIQNFHNKGENRTDGMIKLTN